MFFKANPKIALSSETKYINPNGVIQKSLTSGASNKYFEIFIEMLSKSTDVLLFASIMWSLGPSFV